ncbi:competence/damage-inducible protein A [Geobacter sp. DSM 9736]|uniref:competence/damage-inducible protein A n=1 Tax=Geobacter sp. DSM 9736 TaxID=1277350 RepID=UPI000B50F167|nr:competence/damage-inducible protein A [Geobacter sp. DSM 9736]SNB47213.1 competence/damage-inducible protein cinA [Geobacter sp. DSM 9736]
MKIALLSIGDELLFGEVVDTNAPFIARKLYDLGFGNGARLTAGDAEAEIVDALQYLSERSAAVIVTGGLGPTIDDVTARAAATLAGAPLVINEQALDHTRRMTCKLGGDAALGEKQALLPEPAEVIPNPEGTACGFRLVYGRCTLFFLPGVPKEMMRMLEENVLPYLSRMRQSSSTLQTKVLKVFGIAEAEVDPLLLDVAEPGVTVAFGVEFPEILIKLRGEGKCEAEVSDRLARVAERVRVRLRDYLFAEDEETIDTTVANLFRRTGLTLSLAESCTGGLLAKRITDLAGSSAYFLEGAVTYSNAAKIRALQVPTELVEQEGAVSESVAAAMAEGMRRASGSDIALSITGIAGPEGGSAEKPAGTVYIALADSSDCRVVRCNFRGNRNEIRLITSFKALDLLRRHLLQKLV